MIPGSILAPYESIKKRRIPPQPSRDTIVLLFRCSLPASCFLQRGLLRAGLPRGLPGGIWRLSSFMLRAAFGTFHPAIMNQIPMATTISHITPPLKQGLALPSRTLANASRFGPGPCRRTMRTGSACCKTGNTERRLPDPVSRLNPSSLRTPHGVAAVEAFVARAVADGDVSADVAERRVAHDLLQLSFEGRAFRLA